MEHTDILKSKSLFPDRVKAKGTFIKIIKQVGAAQEETTKNVLKT